MSRKKFYTFEELSNYLSKLERNKEVRPDYKFYTDLYNEWNKWFEENIDDEEKLLFILYHRGDVKLNIENPDTRKVYPKKMWDINPFLGMKDE